MTCHYILDSINYFIFKIGFARYYLQLEVLKEHELYKLFEMDLEIIQTEYSCVSVQPNHY